ncbi:MAG: GntR family transcriptional regulator [Clostridiales bacterium]|jgi:DNA-binding transcriptional regulator YhcF (GntR family)|nr:GntR family transcriptional regulator [Clostridiales bacterium]
MKGQFDSSAPIFMQIVEQMMGDIAKGLLKPGEKVAPVRVLAAEYKVNPNTMQKSLEKLGDMGYLYTERTSGRFVTEDVAKIEALKREIPAKMTADYLREMLDFGIAPDEIQNYVKNYLEVNNGQNT